MKKLRGLAFCGVLSLAISQVGALVLAVTASRVLLAKAVSQSVRLNTADRERNTREILEKLDVIEKRIKGERIDAAADWFR